MTGGIGEGMGPRIREDNGGEGWGCWPRHASLVSVRIVQKPGDAAVDGRTSCLESPFY